MKLAKKISTFTFTSAALRLFGTLFLLSGLIGTMLQNDLTGGGSMTNEALLEAMQADSGVMLAATWALVLKVLEGCALPVYVFLMLEGVKHTSAFGKYYLRVLGVAAVSQLPYNLVMTGSFLSLRGLNPAFALVMAMTMVYFFRRFSQKKASHLAVKALAVLGTFLWSNMLGIEHGAACVLLTAALWALRGKQNLQTFAGVLVCFGCCLLSLYYIAAPVSFLILYFYGGEKGSGSRAVNYGLYPGMLAIAGVLSLL